MRHLWSTWISGISFHSVAPLAPLSITFDEQTCFSILCHYSHLQNVLAFNSPKMTALTLVISMKYFEILFNTNPKNKRKPLNLDPSLGLLSLSCWPSMVSILNSVILFLLMASWSYTDAPPIADGLVLCPKLMWKFFNVQTMASVIFCNSYGSRNYSSSPSHASWWLHFVIYLPT